MKYFARFTANNGNTYNKEPYEYTNKRKTIVDIKHIAEGNHSYQKGNTTRYCVWDENDICVAAGAIHDLGWWSKDTDAVGMNIDEI